MNPSISFIHAADLHIDSPFKGMRNAPENVFESVRHSTFDAYDRLIDTALEKAVDFVLIVGDLFDHEQQSLKAQLHVKKGFERLEAADIAVYLSYGNHDYIEGNHYPIEFPENVHTFSEANVTAKPFTKDDETIAHIYGFSYVQRDVRENKATQFTVTNETIPYHIAMLHGTL